MIVVEDGISQTGETEEVCFKSLIPVEYYCRVKRPALSYSNPASRRTSEFVKQSVIS